VLSETEVQAYRDQGYLLVKDAVSKQELKELRSVTDGFIERSRQLTADDSAIELEEGHTAANPRVRRIKQPHKQHPAYAALLRSASILDPVRSLIGNDLRLIGTKVNIKAAHGGTSVEWHQDWGFYPHTNEDLLAVGVLLDDVGPDNAPLLLVPESHHGPVCDHSAGGVFAGGFDPPAQGLDVRSAAAFTGPAGSISLHHVRLVHGSGINRSNRDRRMLFIEIAAADAWPLVGGIASSPNWFEGNMISGSPTTNWRMEALPIRIPLPEAYSRPLSDDSTLYKLQEHLLKRYFHEVGKAS
jgi:ectoine hydroxylase-related dioxygenase (phytanoyl-CoA dioxygenase family)